MALQLPKEVDTYLSEIVKRLSSYLRNQLVGVYLFGSASYGAYEQGISDLDVQAIVKRRLQINEKEHVVQLLNQKSLPCPARKLEFVVYAQSNIDPASRHPQFEFNLNTGPNQPDHVSLDPSQESSHWFLLDIAMGRQVGRRSLHGAVPTDVFAPIPRTWILDAIMDSLEWHRTNEPTSANGVLNACRGWRYIVTGAFGSKLAGKEWALQQQGCPTVVQRSTEARKIGQELPAADVAELYDMIVNINRQSIGTGAEMN